MLNKPIHFYKIRIFFFSFNRFRNSPKRRENLANRPAYSPQPGLTTFENEIADQFETNLEPFVYLSFLPGENEIKTQAYKYRTRVPKKTLNGLLDEGKLEI